MKRLCLLFCVFLFSSANAFFPFMLEAVVGASMVEKAISKSKENESSCDNYVIKGETASDCFLKLRNEFSASEMPNNEIIEVCQSSVPEKVCVYGDADED